MKQRLNLQHFHEVLFISSWDDYNTKVSNELVELQKKITITNPIKTHIVKSSSKQRHKNQRNKSCFG